MQIPYTQFHVKVLNDKAMLEKVIIIFSRFACINY